MVPPYIFFIIYVLYHYSVVSPSGGQVLHIGPFPTLEECQADRRDAEAIVVDPGNGNQYKGWVVQECQGVKVFETGEKEM